MTQQTAAAAASDQLWGHPKGVYYLAMTEAWERFSFYGMRGLLILYLVQELLLPGHVENVVGMATFRPVVEGIFGQLSDQAFASQLFGLYAGFVYFTRASAVWPYVWLVRADVGPWHMLMCACSPLIWNRRCCSPAPPDPGSGLPQGKCRQVATFTARYGPAAHRVHHLLDGINNRATSPVICGLLAQSTAGHRLRFAPDGHGDCRDRLFIGSALRTDRRSMDEAHPSMTRRTGS